MSSIQRSGCFLAFANPVDAFLRQYQQYLKSFIWLWINFVVNGWQEVKQIAPLSLIIRRYCFHRSSNGMIASHRQFVIPYGRSHKIMSILLSGYIDIPEIQSMLKIRLIYSNCLINVTCLSFLKKDRQYSFKSTVCPCPAAFPGLSPTPGIEPGRAGFHPPHSPLCYIGIKSSADPHKRRIIFFMIYHAINRTTALPVLGLFALKGTAKNNSRP